MLEVLFVFAISAVAGAATGVLSIPATRIAEVITRTSDEDAITDFRFGQVIKSGSLPGRMYHSLGHPVFRYARRLLRAGSARTDRNSGSADLAFVVHCLRR